MLRHPFLLLKFLIGAWLFLELVSCVSTTEIVDAREVYGIAATNLKQRDQVIRIARREIGDAYQYAGQGPDRWDCSGLIQHSFSAAGIPLDRTSRDMSKTASGIVLSKARKGDLIFFKKDGRVFHVSLITEYNKEHLWVIHSTTSRGVIEEDIKVSKYWKSKIYKVISLASLLER